MKKKEDYSLYKYYKGEKENPYDREKNYVAYMFWAGEELYNQNIKNNSEFLETVKQSFTDFLNETKEQNLLTDNKIPFEKRMLIYYLDLWHGKWFPYDNADLIFEY